MGIDMFIGEEQVRLTNSYYYNEFLNWVAMMGEYPSILDHSPIHGYYSHNEDEEIGEYTGQIKLLKKEVEELITFKPPPHVDWVLRRILEAIRISEENNTTITMDDGAWEGET